MSRANLPLAESDRDAVVTWAKRHPVIEAVWLYGSRARGDHHAKSDIDLAVMMQELDWYWWHTAWERAPDLELAYPIHLEWYRPDAGLKIIGAAIERDGVLLYQR